MADRSEKTPFPDSELMRIDMQRIDDYGGKHLAEYGGHWFEDHQHAYGVAFTGSVSEHETALRKLLRYPDLLRLRQCTYSHAFLRQMQEAIFRSEQEKNLDGSLRASAVHGAGVDVINNVVVLRVLPGQPEVEERLVNQYGTVIRIERSGPAVAF